MNEDISPQDLWSKQYPYGGFAFGRDKPTVHLVQEKGKQITRFEGSAINGEVRRCLYPNFSLKEWTSLVYDDMDSEWVRTLGINEKGPLKRAYSPEVIQALIDTSAPGEKHFVDTYFDYSWFEEHYDEDDRWEAPDWIPAPIPQVWIQWHSETVEELKAWGSPYATQPQRIDFAMFWNNRRFAILIDGIQHYGTKEGKVWRASEERYAGRLLEDRFLRKNDWEVFRISNWELRPRKKDNSLLSKVFGELQEIVGFEFFPNWRKEEWVRRGNPPIW